MILPDGTFVKVIHLRIYIEPSAATGSGSMDRYFRTMNDYMNKEKRPYSIRREGLVPLTKGGKTVVQMLDKYDQDHVVAEGVAYCNPTDNYNRRLGKEIALGRAQKQRQKKEKTVG